jgi:hypothetical protein
MQNKYLFVAALLVGGALTACGDDYNDPTTPAPTPPAPVTPVVELVTGSGDITASVTSYRALLGEPRNGGAVGPSATGRREVNWDGVPAEFNNAENRFPAAFFNTTVKLGLVMTTPATGFRNDSSLFGDLDASLRDQFATFSPNKLFTVSNGNVIDVLFQLPGQPTPAVVSGFGAVFVDVDVADRTTLEYFDRANRSLGIVTVPVRTAGSALSFAGAKFANVAIARVRITLGTGAVRSGLKDISSGGTIDAVVLDDFLYSEPQPF